MNIGMIYNTSFKGTFSMHHPLVKSNNPDIKSLMYPSYDTNKIESIEEKDPNNCTISYKNSGKHYIDDIKLPVEKVLAAYTAASCSSKMHVFLADPKN